MGQPGPDRWWGVGIRLLATLFFLLLLLALSRCGPATAPEANTAAVGSNTGAPGTYLRVDVGPAGSTVLVDGQAAGVTPLFLEMAPGPYRIRVELDGYEPLEQAITLGEGEEVALSGELMPQQATPGPTVTLIPTGSGQAGGPLPDLVVQQARIELETGGACDYAATTLGLAVWVHNAGDGEAGPFVVDAGDCQAAVDAGLATGQTVRLWFGACGYRDEHAVTVDAESQVAERDEGNNTFSGRLPVPTLPPTCTPPGEAPVAPTETPTPASPPAPTTPPPPQPSAVRVHEGQVTIPTYPYAGFLSEGRNERYGVVYLALDRAAYEASSPAPQPLTYQTIVVENEYLALTFLPAVGGRLYEVVYKPTGHRETYRNPVLKPSPWGPPEQGWWLAAGGFEWCLPVEEHGYEWGVPWTAEVRQDGQGATVYLRDAADRGDRVRAEIAVRLEAGAGAFSIRPRLENPTGAPLGLKYWTNAMLAPGGPNAPSADLRFVLPDAVTAVTVHSRGDESLPGYNERLPWPVYQGVDLSRLGNWNRWLGFFEDPAVAASAASPASFVAVYDGAADEGMVRAFSADVAAGVKGFGFGWADAIPASNWTDDGSGYVEIHGGPAPTFDDSVTLPAGGHLQWTETWYPVAGLGGLRYGNGRAALNLSAGGGLAQVGVAVTRAWSGEAVLLVEGQVVWRQALSLAPGQPFRAAVPLGVDLPSGGRLTLRLEGADGMVTAEYGADFGWR